MIKTYVYNEKEYFTKIINESVASEQEKQNIMRLFEDGRPFVNLKIVISEVDGLTYEKIYNFDKEIKKDDLTNDVKSIVSSCFNNFIGIASNNLHKGIQVM